MADTRLPEEVLERMWLASTQAGPDLHAITQAAWDASPGRALLESCSDLLKMVEAAHRQLGMWVDTNPRLVKARAAIALARGL